MASTWKDVWERRRVDPNLDSVLSRLLALDGFDTAFGRIGDEAYHEYVSRTSGKIGVTPGESSVFDVGCGAGAYLFDLYEQGCSVGGLDFSSALIRMAAEAMPSGNWIQADAAELDVDTRYDFVVASSSFHYFPSLEFAAAVIERMVRKARRGIMLLDVPDLALRDQAIASRRSLAGDQAYAEKYDSLKHLYFDRSWIRNTLSVAGVSRVEISGQQIDGYSNVMYRYNVFGWISGEGKDG